MTRPAPGRWQALRSGLVAALGRFPVSVAALASLAVYANLVIAEVIVSDDDALRAHMALGGAAMIAAAAVLLGERSGIGAAPRHLLSLLVAAALGAAMWHWERLGIAFPALFLATALTIPLAPYLRRDPNGFWAFAWHLLHAAMLAFLAVIIFCLGLSAIIASIDYLFGVDIEGDIYEHIWVTGLGFVGPVFALSLIPAAFPERDAPQPNDMVVAGVRILSDFVVVPLLLNYAAVLHVYAAKIALIDGTLPRGQIGWMVLGFGLAVLGARIVVHPMGSLVRWPTRLFLRFWAIGLVVPLGLLAVAVWERVDAYGITPERYALALYALVLAIIIAMQLVPRLRGDVRLIAGIGALALFATSVGPWGMISVSVRSQLDRLVDHLAEAGAMADGALTARPELSREAALDARSIVRLVDDLGQLDRLRPLLAGTADDPFAGDAPATMERVRQALNVDTIPPAAGDIGRFAIREGTGAAAITGYDIVVPHLELGANELAVTLEIGAGTLALEPRDPADGLVLAIGSGAGTLTLTLEHFREVFQEHLASHATLPESERPPFLVALEVEGKRMAFLFRHGSGKLTDAEFTLDYGVFDLFLREEDWESEGEPESGGALRERADP